MSSLLSAQEIISQSVSPKRTRGIYFLIYRGEIVYVGQSGHIEFRLISHANGDKVFDRYTVIDYGDVPQEDLNDAEADYIVEYAPVYNNGLPPNSKWATLNMIKSRFPLHLSLIKKFIRQQRINDRNGYYLWSDFMNLPTPRRGSSS